MPPARRKGRPFYFRALAKSFPSARTARRNVEYLRSAAGARETSRSFLRAFLAKTGFRPRVLQARPLPWRGNTGGFGFTFEAPNGLIEGVMLGIARGQLLGGATIMGRPDEIDPQDLLALRDVIREQLAAAR